ncbi:MAG: hypothetical protein R2748_27520 [Bryobacterales bacterium]
MRPSKALCGERFLDVDVLPAWQAQMVPSECQKLGVAKKTTSMSLSSRVRAYRRQSSDAAAGELAVVHAPTEHVLVDVAEGGDLDVLVRCSSE